MPARSFQLRLRPATLDDAGIVADLESVRDPTDPRDPVLMRHRWQVFDRVATAMRRVDVRDGAAVAFVGASHERWQSSDKRFGNFRPLLRDDVWSERCYGELVGIAEDWLRGQDGITGVVRLREIFGREIAALERLGYSEKRGMRISELDLVARREHILTTAKRTREEMEQQGFRLQPLSEDGDPERYRKLYGVMLEAGDDVPSTVPRPHFSFEEWSQFWLENPAIREDLFWIARQGDQVVGMSVLDSPVVRGIPTTAFTGTARSVRGRGIARALKYQSMAQAIEGGHTRVRTTNDADNPAILRINQEMGYMLVAPLLEFHRKLAP
jgi:hypothetical protein